MPDKKSPTKKKKSTASKPKSKAAAKTKEVTAKTEKISRRQRLRNRRQNAKSARAAFKPLSSGFRVFRDSLSFVRQYWKLYLGVTLIYLVLSVILVGGLGGGYDVQNLREDFGQKTGELGASLSIIGLLVGSAGSNTNEGGAAYQTMILIIVSLATIWMVRQLMAGQTLKLRDPFYKGMYPLVPFMLLMLMLCVHLLPAVFGGFVFSSVVRNGLVVTTLEYILWLAITGVFFAVSLYILSASLFALFVVTLPDMAPRAALKNARKIVQYRRWIVMRKLLLLPLLLFVIGVLVLLPLISFVPALVIPVFVLLSMFVLPFSLTYVYMLYRELL
jgi:hypothetical protein